MDKIGFALGVVSAGFRVPLKYNDGEWSSKVRDTRDYLKYLTGFQNENSTVTFLSFLEDGCYIVIVKKIAGREGDSKSCWVYIPNEIDVPFEAVYSVYNFVKNHLCEDDWGDEKVQCEVKDFFNKEYEVSRFPAKHKVNRSVGAYAYRMLDARMNLYDLLSKGDIYQDYYADYEVVFLLEREGDIAIDPQYKGSFTDLTDKKIERYVCLLPPSAPVGDGVTIYKDGKPFNETVLVRRGENVQFVAKRTGYEDHSFGYEVKDDDEQVLSVPVFKWLKHITFSMFKLRDKETLKDVHGANISLNGRELSVRTSQDLSEEECRNVTVKVKAPGYELYSQDMNLLEKLKKNDVIQIHLQKSEGTKDIQIELANGQTVKATLSGKYLPSDSKQLLKGYEPQGKIYKYQGNSGWHWCEFICGLAAAAALALVVWMLVPDSKNDSALIDAEKETQLDEATDALFSYLNSNDKWEKVKVDSLAENTDYKELYDKINSYDFYYFAEQISVDSAACPKLHEVIVKAQEAKSREIQINGKYSEDGSITISKWIEKVEKKQEGKKQEEDVTGQERNTAQEEKDNIPSSPREDATVPKQTSVASKKEPSPKTGGQASKTKGKTTDKTKANNQEPKGNKEM